MRCLLPLACLIATSLPSSDAEDRFHLQDSDNQLEVHYGDQRIATCLKQHDKLTRPAWVNLCLPSGIQVTRRFPAKNPEDLDPGYSGEGGIIHPIMHPGLWISYGNLDGHDYWRLKAKVHLVEAHEIPQSAGDQLSFSLRNLYLSESGDKTICTETVRYDWRRVPQGIAIDVQATYQSPDEFYFGDQEESGLGMRVASSLRVNGGNGTILNNRGEKNGAEVWGKEAKWVDYFGTIDNKEVGVMIVPHRNNPRPCWMHARDYGLIVANPFPKQPMERKEPYKKTSVPAGEQYSFGWTVLLHELPEGEKLDREKVAADLGK